MSGDATVPGVAGELNGKATRRLANDHCWLDFLAQGGPRIVGFGLTGSSNVLAETPNSRWDAGFGMYELFGGHRLWFAPEGPACSCPDMSGLRVEAIDGGARLVGAVEAASHLRKTFEIRLADGSAAVSVRHILTNEGDRSLELSPWPITQLRLGGIARVEMPAIGEGSAPNQIVGMWPYASWDDARLSIREGELSVAANPDKPFKVGCLNRTGVVSYEIDDLVFVKHYDPAVDRPHADLGCNLEIYVDTGTIELESLGPLVKLAPGESTTWDETWELRRR